MTGAAGGVSEELDLKGAQARMGNEAERKDAPTRNRTRVKARVLACIRRRGFQEEVAVCEDLSRGGLSFRSRNLNESFKATEKHDVLLRATEFTLDEDYLKKHPEAAGTTFSDKDWAQVTRLDFVCSGALPMEAYVGKFSRFFFADGSKELLITALSQYEGTMLFVSHDRHFLAALSNRVLELTPEGIHTYGGGYTEYVERTGHEAPGLRS